MAEDKPKRIAVEDFSNNEGHVAIPVFNLNTEAGRDAYRSRILERFKPEISH